MNSIVAVVTLCFIASAIGDGVEDKLTFGQVLAYKRACIAETGVDIETLFKIRSREQEVFDEKVKCYMACMLKKTGVIKDDQSLDEDAIRFKVLQGLPEDKIDKFIDACRTDVGKESCETGGIMLKCALDNHSLLFLE